MVRQGNIAILPLESLGQRIRRRRLGSLGTGSPGLAFECSAMATALLGDQIDIHWGESITFFPPKPNRANRGCTGKGVCLLWLHCAHLLSMQKMSKSLEFLYDPDSRQRFYGREIRYALMRVLIARHQFHVGRNGRGRES